MAKCINDIINPNIKASPTKDATSKTVADKTKTGDEKKSDSFLDTIEKASERLRKTDCTQAIGDYFSSQFPKTSNTAGKIYNTIVDDINLESGMKSLASGVDKLSNVVGFDAASITSSFCVTISSFAHKIIFYIDVALKAAPLLFKKLDKLRARLEAVLTDFNDSVRDCLVGVIVDTKTAVNKVVTSVLDFDILVELTDSCPCVAEILKSMFPFCKEDEFGNEYTTGEQIVECIQSYYNINPTDIVNAINDFVDNTVIGNIDKGFNVVDELIRNVIETIFTPIRELFKAFYCDVLAKKVDVSLIIRLLGDYKCLLIYSNEIDDFGREYKGMNIYDMLDTLKLWVNCFDTVCDGLTEDYRLKIKQANEELRIDDKFWRDIMFMDLYQSCVAANVQRQQSRPTMIREIYIKNKGKNSFIDIIDVFKDIGKVSTDVGINEKTLGEVAQALKFANGPEAEDVNLGEGTEKFSEGVEEKVKDVIRNIRNSLDREPYYELFLQLVDWESNYIKSDDHISLIYDVVEKNERASKNIPTARLLSTARDNGASDRVKFGKDRVIDTLYFPTYELNNDYDQDDINSIIDFDTPDQNENETKEAYYNRWYMEIFA